MPMLPVIADRDFNRVAVFDDYISFIWTTRYYEVGDFELCLSVDDRSLRFIQYGFYVLRDDDEHAGIIERIQIQRTEDGQDMIVASGRFLSSILARRIVHQQTQVYGTVETCVKKLIDENVIDPDDTDRRIPGFVYGEFDTPADTFRAQYTGKNLLEIVAGICKTYGLGFRTILNEEDEFEFSVFAGVDRSYAQTVNPYVIFSDKYENLSSSDYEENYENIVTDVLVAGEGEGLDRKTIWARKETLTGLARYEMYKDARNQSTNEGEIPEAQYYAELEADGLESVSAYNSAFVGEVYFGENIQSRRDVGIGDICVIQNSAWGLSIAARLVEVIESVGEDGAYTVVPSFEFFSAIDRDGSEWLRCENEDILWAEDGDGLLLEGE